MKYFSPFLAGILILLLSCSKDDGSELSEVQTATLPDYTVIGENFFGVFQFIYSGDTENGSQINLTEESNVLREYLTLRQVSETLTFFVFSAGKFSAVQRNIFTGATDYINEFYTDSNERSVIWGATSEEQIFLATYSPRGSSNFGIRIFNIDTEEEEDLFIEEDVNSIYQPLYMQGKLFLVYLDEQLRYKLTVIDTNLKEIIRTFDFGNSAPSIFITESNDLGIISGDNDNSYNLEVYDSNTLEVLRQENLILNGNFRPGAVQTQVKSFEEGLFYLNYYPQPAPFRFGPAFYDIRSKENTVVDMATIGQQIQNEIGLPIELTAFDYNSSTETFLVGYTTFISPNILEGGILIISKQGELLEHEVLNFAPDYFIQ